MKIFGYSERGVMNALFYGIAYKGDKKDIDTLLELCDDCPISADYEIIMEGSLSDFGDPDAIIIGKDKDGKNTNLYFIEGKVSAGGHFSLNDEKEKFDEAMSNNKAYKGFSSSLFGQLTLKYQLTNINQRLPSIITSKKNRKGDSVNRKSGENPIVGEIIKKINSCNNKYYIAITPDKNTKLIPICYNNITLFNVHCICWDDINKDPLKKFISQTIEFNQVKDKHDQINNL